MSVVDLRSDTVTKPTPAMREAMASAELGDDVLGDDSTVQRLEEMAAAKVGMEAGLFVPSGTMGNQIALAIHCRPGDAAIFEENAHMLMYEAAGSAVIASVLPRIVVSGRGVMDPDEVRRKVLARSHHTPGTVLLCLENTHNRGGGTVTPPETVRRYRAVADEAGMKIHLDGARIFNASVALGVDVRDLTAPCDSVNFCLSKGLGAPVGSVLCGPSEFIAEAKYWRKRLGGGMRQSGLLAACGMVCLESMIDRLAEDHARARALAAGLQEVPGLTVDPAVETNMVMVDTDAPAPLWCEHLRDAGIWALPFGPNRIRLVTHYDVSDEGVTIAVAAFARIAQALNTVVR